MKGWEGDLYKAVAVAHPVLLLLVRLVHLVVRLVVRLVLPVLVSLALPSVEHGDLTMTPHPPQP